MEASSYKPQAASNQSKRTIDRRSVAKMHQEEQPTQPKLAIMDMQHRLQGEGVGGDFDPALRRLARLELGSITLALSAS